MDNIVKVYDYEDAAGFNFRDLVMAPGERERIAREVVAELVKAIDDEPELPGDPPEGLMDMVQQNPVEALRCTVIATKNRIRERLAALFPTPVPVAGEET